MPVLPKPCWNYKKQTLTLGKSMKIVKHRISSTDTFKGVRTQRNETSDYMLNLCISQKTPSRSSSSVKASTPSTGAPQMMSSGQTGRTPDTQKTLSPEFCAEDGDALMWVDRYKPTNSKQIIGQQGDKSNAKKLLNWLTSWHKNLGKKPVCKFCDSIVW